MGSDALVVSAHQAHPCRQHGRDAHYVRAPHERAEQRAKEGVQQNTLAALREELQAQTKRAEQLADRLAVKEAEQAETQKRKDGCVLM